MAQKYDFDAIVIGAGSGGLTSSIGLSKVGKKVLLIERDRMGGECTNTGCIPSKSLIHHAGEYFQAKKRAGETDMLKAYKSSIFHLVRKKITAVRSEESPEEIAKKHKIKVVMGEASFVDAHTVAIQKKMGNEQHTAKHIIIATGSSARRVEIAGLDPEKLLTNENVFELQDIPQRMVIVGGGPIGCEIGQALAHMGTEVTIVNKTPHLLFREEPEVSQHTQEMFENQGIKVINNAVISKAEGHFVIAEEKKGGKTIRHKLACDKVLLGIGRVPNTKSLNLDAAGIECTDSGIKVDKHYRTTKKHIFAVGDVSSRAKFTHVADDQGRHIVKKILLPWYRGKSNKPLPRVTYLDEEVASVGMTFSQAKTRYGQKEIMKISMPYGNTDRANTDEAQSGIAMVIVKRISGRILGASLMGKHAGELLSVFTLAIQNKISMYKINAMIAPYPVLGRLYKKLSDAFIGETFKHLKPDLKYAIRKQLPKIIAVVIWLAVIIGFTHYKAVNDLTSLDLAKQIFDFVTGTTYGPLIYIVIYALRPILFFPATLLTLISGALFGFWGGVLYTIIGENLSANLAYAIGRFLGQDFCRPDLEGETSLLSTWSKELRENAFISVLIMRFIYLPFDLVNYGCGILCVSWPSYMLATFVGILPGLVTFVSFGATIENIESFNLGEIGFNPMQLLVSVVLFVGSLVIARLVQSQQRKKKLAVAKA